MFNYHDTGFLVIDRAAMNKAMFKALKPGGMYVIADHSGRPGTGISESGTLHRIEQAFLQQEVEAAGFKLVAEGNFLRNPNDPRDKNTPYARCPRTSSSFAFRPQPPCSATTSVAPCTVTESLPERRSSLFTEAVVISENEPPLAIPWICQRGRASARAVRLS